MYAISNNDCVEKNIARKEDGECQGGVQFKHSVVREGLTEVTLGGRAVVGEGVPKCLHGRVSLPEQILNPRGSSLSGNFRVLGWLMLSKGSGRWRVGGIVGGERGRLGEGFGFTLEKMRSHWKALSINR